MQHGKWSIYSLALMAMVFWGLSYVWTKVAFEFYRPVTVMFIRLSLSSVLLFLLFGLRGKLQRIARSDYKAFLILSFFSPFCYFIGENYGLMHVSPTVAAVVIATIPVFTPLLGFIAFRERLSVLNIAGFLVSFSGILIMVLDDGFRFTASPLGLFFLFFAVLSALVNIIFLKKLTFRYSSFTIIWVQNLLGALFFLPLFLAFELGDVIHIRPSATVVGSLVALAVFGSTLAFVFFTTTVRSIGVARTAIFTNLIPVITAIFSFAVLGERIDLSKVIGMQVVIIGLVMTQFHALQQRKKNLQA